MAIFQIAILLLFLMALADLIVGVSNDAVNFLNSAVGSGAATFRTILIIASAGVLVGTFFSDGMMQVARNGIFQPEFFTFDKVMVIFLAVMLTDVILLDFYNTLGLPTSTTVSLIFELLGASTAVGLLVLSENDRSINELSNVLNFGNAFGIVGGIFFSVAVAFVVGSASHFFIRLIFTFRLRKTIRVFGALFTGAALTVLLHFLFIKGLEGSALVSAYTISWIHDRTLTILVFSFLVISALTWIAMRLMAFNPLRLVVLVGTFALAMAFAGNDLVNFVGVPVAAFNAFQLWREAGVDAAAFHMDGLNGEMTTPTWLLLTSSLVMVATLWLSKKSRTVTETEVSLGRQDEGDERFRANLASRWLVGVAVGTGKKIVQALPSPWKRGIEKRLIRPGNTGLKMGQQSFDLLRASVNLVVSSALIALGTANQLPLSTTFVTFMVAMGTSFADQAWGRDSAVFRVAGVLGVINGWVLTALIAFLGSMLCATLLFYSGPYGMLLLVAAGLSFLVWNQVRFNRAQKKLAKADQLIQQKEILAKDLLALAKLDIGDYLLRTSALLKLCWQSLKTEKQRDLHRQSAEIRKLLADNREASSKIVRHIRKLEKSGLPFGRRYLKVFNTLQDVYQSALLISDVCEEHVANSHPTPGKEFLKILRQAELKIDLFLAQIIKQMEGIYSKDSSAMVLHGELVNFFAQALDTEIINIQKKYQGPKLSILQTRLLLELSDLADTCLKLSQSYDDLYASLELQQARETLIS